MFRATDFAGWPPARPVCPVRPASKCVSFVRYVFLVPRKKSRANCGQAARVGKVFEPPGAIVRYRLTLRASEGFLGSITVH